MKNRSTGRLGGLLFNTVTLESRSPGSVVPSHSVTLECRSPGSVVMKKGKTTDAGTLRAARHSSMTLCDERRSGFTLIELLVVVLIIGILAAVALPQYQAAVTRTRLAELQILTRSIKDAEERYFMANGEYTNAFSDLDISLPGTGIPNVAEYWKPTDQAVCVLSAPRDVYCVNSQGGSHVSGWQIWLDRAENAPQTLCYAYAGNKAAEKACLSMGGVLRHSGNGMKYYAVF